MGIGDFSAAEMAVAGKEDLTKFDEIYCYKVTGQSPDRVLCITRRPRVRRLAGGRFSSRVTSISTTHPTRIPPQSSEPAKPT